MEKLFWGNSYLKECKAVAKKISERNVWLSETIFYAFSGGQESDSGKIAGIDVIKATAIGSDIQYTLEREPNFKIGDEVEVKIDWEKRYKIMKLHTAAHLAYFLFTEEVGEPVMIGGNISDEKARIDFAYSASISPIIPKLQHGMNELISSNLKIGTYPDNNDPEKRWWTLPDKNWKMPCGGTHVNYTGEIEEIKLKRKNLGSGKERIELHLV